MSDDDNDGWESGDAMDMAADDLADARADLSDRDARIAALRAVFKRIAHEWRARSTSSCDPRTVALAALDADDKAAK